MSFSSLETAKQRQKDLVRRQSGELLTEVAEHVKQALKAEDLENVVLDEEEERQRRISESNNPLVATDDEIRVDDREQKEAAIARVRLLEEDERHRRLSEFEEDEHLQSELNKATSILEEETERTLRLCDKQYDHQDEAKAHKEASLIRDMLEDKEIEDREIVNSNSKVGLIDTVLEEIEEKKRRVSTGDVVGKIHGHMTASIVKEHLQECNKCDMKRDAERKSEKVECAMEEMEERRRRQSFPVKQHDIAHAKQEADLVTNDPLRWKIPPTSSSHNTA